jgi:hypothetical protein
MDLEKLFDYLEKISVWQVASVKDEPETQLSQWRIFLVDGKDIHFVGYTGWEGRVCSAVQTFDPTTRRGVTRSGRIYELVGHSGFNGDAMYTWNRWLGINGNPPAEDVTDTYIGK